MFWRLCLATVCALAWQWSLHTYDGLLALDAICSTLAVLSFAFCVLRITCKGERTARIFILLAVSLTGLLLADGRTTVLLVLLAITVFVTQLFLQYPEARRRRAYRAMMADTNVNLGIRIFDAR